VKTNPSKGSDEVTTIGAFEAKTHLSKLLRQARAGKRFIITQRGKPVAELRSIETPRGRKGRWGDMKGKLWIADDFNDEIEVMRDYME
jgi:prevent-host-death family protein